MPADDYLPCPHGVNLIRSICCKCEPERAPKAQPSFDEQAALGRAGYNDKMLIDCWHTLRVRATEAEGEMYRLRDEADEVLAMLGSRGYHSDGKGGWVRRRNDASASPTEREGAADAPHDA